MYVIVYVQVAEGELGGITQRLAAFTVGLRSDYTAQATDTNEVKVNKRSKAAAAYERSKAKAKTKGSKGSDTSPEASGEDASVPSTASPEEGLDTSSSASSPRITFIDTPGHAAFSRMRSGMAKLVDLCIVVIGVDDGIQPQTKEVLELLREQAIPMVVAINKIDRLAETPTEIPVRIAKIEEELSAVGVFTEKFGGDVQVVGISARTGMYGVTWG